MKKAKKQKRKRDDDLNEFLPDRPRQEGDSYGSLEFNEVLDEEVRPTRTLWGSREYVRCDASACISDCDT